MSEIAGNATHPAVVAIDGPAGSGKSTIAKRLAEALGLEYLDTGAMYRAVTFAVLDGGIDPADETAVAALVGPLDIVVRGSGTVLVEGTDATEAIRTAEVNRNVSVVAAQAAVRTELVGRQRAWAKARGGGVLEGRDIGSAVFPDAMAKIYLTASPQVRAERRAHQIGQTDPAEIRAMADELARRDELDSTRAIDPLAQAEGAIRFDTSDLTIDEVVAELAVLVRARAAEVAADAGGDGG